MSRNSGGTYTLPAGNPVVTGTVISSTWANTTLSDLATAMTDSLSRSGKGGMTASLALADGLIGAPGLSWGTESTSGLYRVSAGVFAYSIAAVDKLRITTNGIATADGAVGTPGFSFISDPDTGVYRIGANDLGVATNGVLRLEVGATGLTTFTNTNLGINIVSTAASAPAFFTPTGQDQWRTGAGSVNVNDFGIFNVTRTQSVLEFAGGASAGMARFVDGTAALPGISFIGDPDTGFFRASSNAFRATVGGVAATTWVNDGTTGQTLISDGALASLSFAFTADTDTGFFRSGANEARIVAGGTTAALWSTIAFYTRLPLYAADGLVGTPGITFENDANTGIYRINSDYLGFTAGGVFAGSVRNALGTGAQFCIIDGTISQPGLAFDGDLDTGFYRTTANQIAITLGGVSGGEIAQTTSTGTFTGCTTAPTTTLRLVRVGNHVICSIDAQTATSNAGTFTLTGAIPALYQPARNQFCTVYVTDNGVNVSGVALIQAGSTTLTFSGVFIGAAGAIAAFTASGTKGINGGTVLSWQMT